jgi:hypothetical protein
MLPIIPRERFRADRRDLLRVDDILIGQARANPRPCLPEFQFAVVEVGAGPPVIAALRSAVDVAGPYPLRPVVRCPVAEHEPADRHAAPHHRVIVSVALAGDCGGAEGQGFGIGHAPLKRGRSHMIKLLAIRNRGSCRSRNGYRRIGKSWFLMGY